MGGEINNELFKKLENSDGIWEFRTKYNGIAYRLFSFWDTEIETLVIATHGISRKLRKLHQRKSPKPKELSKCILKRKLSNKIRKNNGRFKTYIF